MHLFQTGSFVLHSGEYSPIKVECDALTELDWGTLAYIVTQRFTFSNVIGIPRGGIPFAEALQPYASNLATHPWLIVDDVLNTGGSMEKERAKLGELGKEVYGVVVFARKPTPEWIFPIFQMWPTGVVSEWKPETD